MKTNEENVQDLGDRLQNSYSRIVYPKAMGDMPIELDKMKIVDEDGNITGYYSINSLAKALGGKTLVPLPFNNEGTLMHIRWSFDKANDGADEKATRALLLENGLTDMSANCESIDIVIGELIGNEFGLFDMYEFKQIPKEVIDETITASSDY